MNCSAWSNSLRPDSGTSHLLALRDAAVDKYFWKLVVDTFDTRILMAMPVKYTVNSEKPKMETCTG